jgi:cation transport ATPase
MSIEPPEESPRPSHGPSSEDRDAGSDDRHLRIAEMIVGTAMMFVGFLTILLSISGGFELAGVTPALLYFAGMTIWAHATIVNTTVRYSVMIVAITFALGFFHYGEMHFWHKQVIFWATVAMVMFFMFKTATPDGKTKG